MSLEPFVVVFDSAAQANLGDTFFPTIATSNRRLAKGYERRVQTSETLISIAAIR
jgi:hypothetical protein